MHARMAAPPAKRHAPEKKWINRIFRKNASTCQHTATKNTGRVTLIRKKRPKSYRLTSKKPIETSVVVWRANFAGNRFLCRCMKSQIFGDGPGERTIRPESGIDPRKRRRVRRDRHLRTVPSRTPLHRCREYPNAGNFDYQQYCSSDRSEQRPDHGALVDGGIVDVALDGKPPTDNTLLQGPP